MGNARFGRGTVYSYRALPPTADPLQVRRPVLPVRLHRGRRSLEAFLAIVDSDADVSAFPIDFAARLGIDVGDPSQCRPTKIRGTSGTADAYSCPVEIEVEGRRIPAHVSFAPVPAPLLGRLDVFWHFRFCFDDRAEELLVEPY